jgi:alkylhydroperoxidase family enzyme
LAISVDRDPLLRADVERMAQIFSRSRNEQSITSTTQDAAEAEIDLLRISRIRISIFEAFHTSAKSLQDLTQLNESLTKLDRYERRAFSRRRRALTSV